MAKSFNEHERDTIRQALIEACKQCWNQYGYQKTNVRELAEMANISVGMFYQFYRSKEMLFIDAAKGYESEMEAMLVAAMEASPDRRGVAQALKAIVGYVRSMGWISSMWQEWPVIARKLPPGFLEQDFLQDIIRIEKYATAYGITFKQDSQMTTLVVNILVSSAVQAKLLPGDVDTAYDLMIDAVVDALVE